MKRAIVMAATTLILTAGQAMAEGPTPALHVNGSSPSLVPLCLCTCLDEPDCCFVCHEGTHQPGFADSRPHVVRTTNSYSTAIPGATPYLSGGKAWRPIDRFVSRPALLRSARCGGV
jgi:hypothetical protein